MQPSGILIGDRGELIDAGDPQSGNWFRFRFVFVSCVRASGRGEAVWACERGVFVNAGGLHSNISSGLVCPWVSLFVFVAMLMGFNVFRTDCCYAHGLFDLFLFLMVCSWVFWCFCIPCSLLLLCSWVFWSFLVFDGMLMGFLMLLHTWFAFAAMPMGFLIFSCFWWYAHGFFDAFAHLVRFCCYVHGFFEFF